MNTPYPRLSNQTPVLDLWSERDKHNELIFTDDFTPTPQDVEDAINLLYYQQHVSIYVVETVEGKWSVTVGYKFIKSALLFYNNTMKYPDNGFLEELRGKRFCEIPRPTQRRLKGTALPTCVCQLMDGTEQAHKAIINAASRLGNSQ